ncbi:polysaccharide biosynthesis/export family protein [Kamptonema cortianum]|nr:polysaccharide biosynthesis/export family protein [Kamptonema cortianum]
MFLRPVFIFVLLLLTIGSAFAQAKIKAGDILRLVCIEEPSMNRDYTVTSDGLVLVDFLGAVKVEGLTEAQAASTVQKQLIDQRILAKATVTIQIVQAEIKRVRFGGKVGLEGETPWKANQRLSDIIRLADVLPETDLSRVTILSTDGKSVVIDYTKNTPRNDFNPLMKPGDEVRFVAKSTKTDPTPPDNPPTIPDPPVKPTTTKVSLIGQVALPGDFEVVDGLTLQALIVKAGGFLPSADPGRLTLVRGESKRELKLPEDNHLRIMAGDKITVSTREASKLFATLEGAVVNPGKFELTKGTKLTQLLKLAGASQIRQRRIGLRF